MLRDRRLSRIHLFSIRRILALHHRGDAANTRPVSGPRSSVPRDVSNIEQSAPRQFASVKDRVDALS
jgi:hypothetical protein